MSEHIVDLIIPTYDNIEYVTPCINSILTHTQARGSMRIIVVNNGSEDAEKYITKSPLVKIVRANKNLGWEGGLKLGLEHSKTPFVCFMNDDTFIPYASSLWLTRCLSEFKDPTVAAVGPTTNVVRGFQNIFLDQFTGYFAPYTSLLIFFLAFIRRSHLDEVGGIDETLPGGDDLDLSIRFRKAGKHLVICRDVFIYHHGFKTGERVKGHPSRPGGWNSREMRDRTDKALIQKHGFKAFLECNRAGLVNREDRVFPDRDKESDIVRRLVRGKIIYELGCGASKTVPEAIGVDRVKKGDIIPYLEGAASIADLHADVTMEMPIPDGEADTIITRHLLEHCVDTVGALKLWIKKLKPNGGRLILCVPDERVSLTIPMNPEHRHAFTPQSLDSITSLLGLEKKDFVDDYNGVSFTAVYERNGKA